MWTKAEPNDKGDEPNDCEEAQENSAYHFGSTGCEAILHPLEVVFGGMMALYGLRGWVWTRV